MASSLSAMLASLGRKGEQLVSSATAHISNAAKIAQTAMPDPFHDKASEIDEIREYLGYLSTPQKKFARRNDSTTGLLKERASLTDFLTRAKSILENHRQLFNLDFSKPKNKIHEKPFTDLIAHLEREINHLEAHPEEKTKELFQETLTAVSTALGKLHQLKVTQAGIFTSTARLAEAAPELLQCIAHLNTLKDAILSNNPRKILNAFAPLDLCIDTLLKQKEIVFYGPELTSQHEDVFRELQRIFKAYKALPDSLKQDARFHPNDIELMNAIKNTATALDPYIKSQQTSIKKTLNTILSSGTQFAQDHLPTFGSSTPTQRHYSPLQKLNDALTFFTASGRGYEALYKKNVILALLHECNESHADFETHFLDAIASTNPTEGPLSHEWAKEHLLDYPKTSEAAFKVALKATATALGFAEAHPTKDALLTFLNSRAPVQVDAAPLAPGVAGQPNHSNPLIDYAKSALSLFKGHSSIPATALSMMGNSFGSLLNSAVFNGWIASQKPATAAALTEIKNKTLATLTIAIESNALKDYIAMFEEFIKSLSEPIISVDGIVLTSLFQDGPTKKAQAESAEKLTKSMNELKRALTLAKVKEEDFNWNDQAKVDAKLQGQINEFSENLQDQLTYQFIYETLLGNKNPKDLSFYHIKTLQNGLNKKQRKKLFIDQLKKIIDKSEASGMRKFFAKLTLSKTYQLIGYYVNNIVSKFYKDLDKQLGKIDKQDLLERSGNCFSQYNKLLKAWAEEGGGKTPVIGKLMKTKTFLSCGEESYTQSELYNTVSNTFIQNYFDLYKGDKGQDSSLTASLSSSLSNIKDFIIKRPFYADRSPILSFLNQLVVGVKAVTIGIPSVVVIGIFLLPTMIFEGVSNRFIKYIFRSGLEKFKVIDYIIQSTKQGIFPPNSPYVHAITSFLADQLESLSEELEGINAPAAENTSEGSNPKPNAAKRAISEKTQELIKTAAKSLLEILNKDKNLTQDELKKFLTEKGLVDSFTENLEASIFPFIIDTIIDITAIASDKLLNKKALQQPISLLLDKLNDILTKTPEVANPVTNPEKLKIEELTYLAAEAKLKKYKEKLIDQVITTAIDSAFQQIGQHQTHLVNDTTEWLKEETPLFLDKCNEYLVFVNSREANPKTSYEALETMNQLIRNFLLELGNKIELLKKDSSTASKKLSQSLSEVATSIENFLYGADQERGALTFYTNHKIIYQTKEDLPHLINSSRTYESLKNDLLNLADNFNDTQLVKRLFNSSHYIKRTLSNIHSEDLIFLKDPDNYTNLKALLDAEEKMNNREEAELTIRESLLPMLKSLDLITKRDDGQNLFTLLTTQKNAPKPIGLLNSLRSPADPFIKTYKDLLAKIQKIPSDHARKALTAALNKVYHAKNPATIASSIQGFQDCLKNLLDDEKDKIKIKAKIIIDIDQEFYDEIHKICQKFENNIEECKAENIVLLPEIQEAMKALNAAAIAVKKISFISIETGATSLLKTLPYPIAYPLMKSKLDGLFALLRNGNFSQFFANHVLFMPFIKK